MCCCDLMRPPQKMLPSGIVVEDRDSGASSAKNVRPGSLRDRGRGVESRTSGRKGLGAVHVLALVSDDEYCGGVLKRRFVQRNTK